MFLNDSIQMKFLIQILTLIRLIINYVPYKIIIRYLFYHQQLNIILILTNMYIYLVLIMLI